uniref:Uncharacterized protein n=1 Tax=Myotis myotis TaxID=51298 RepID=A0A7J7XHV1_MYOMY|nr:hypothetical protein mMyoMyo1_011650 [Myotis myotis]
MGPLAASSFPALTPPATGLPALPPRAEAAPAPPDGRPGTRPCPPTAHTSSRTPEPRRARRGRGPDRPRSASFPQTELPRAGEAGSLRAGAWRRGRGRKLGVTLPETPDGAPAWERGRRVRRDSGCPSCSCRPCDPGQSAPLGQGEGRCLWRPPAACTEREGLPLSTLPQRRPPTTPPPRAPPGPAQPGFSIRPGSARQLSGDRADLREQGVSISRRSDKRAGPSLRAPRGRSPAPATPRQTRSRWEQR